MQELRTKIDDVDEQIIRKAVRRMQLCEKVGKIKAREKLPIYVPLREKEVLEKRCQSALKHNLRPSFTRNFFKLIMSESKQLQKKLTKRKSL